jgi:hypothetical protein
MHPLQLLRLAAVAALALLASCRSNHLVLTTYSKVGLDLSASNGQPIDAVFGYKRFEGAIVPVDPRPSKTENGKTTPQESMSVYAAIDLENGWMSGVKLFEAFATGEAAKNLARRPNSALNRVLASRKAEEKQEKEK